MQSPARTSSISRELSERSINTILRHKGTQYSQRLSPVRYVGTKARSRGSTGKTNSDQRSDVLRVASKEPITFLGGVVAGVLALDLKQDPLKSWIEERAAEAGLAYSLAKERLQMQQQQQQQQSQRRERERQ